MCICLFFNGVPCVLAPDTGFTGPYGIARSVPSDDHAVDHPFAGHFNDRVDIEVPEMAVP